MLMMLKHLSFKLNCAETRLFSHLTLATLKVFRKVKSASALISLHTIANPRSTAINNYMSIHVNIAVLSSLQVKSIEMFSNLVTLPKELYCPFQSTVYVKIEFPGYKFSIVAFHSSIKLWNNDMLNG